MGTGDDQSVLRELFDQAVDVPPDQRAAFLESRCGPDRRLRAAVEELLSAHDRAGAFLASPEVHLAHAPELGMLSPGTRVGRYTVRHPLGEGGYGTVYLAEEDPPLQRRVALKVIKPGMDTRQVMARFELERQALARMDHPNIAKVLDAGATATGHPYFVMEQVEGRPITDFCRDRRLDLKSRLRLFVLVCSAVHHAHRKGIVHRDLKPGNVLVTRRDGLLVPKVIDFGIAKALSPDEELAGHRPITREPQLLGTPQYMSPEQASMQGPIDVRSDVYSLGAMLYELLTDTPPFDADLLRSASYEQIARTIRETDPPSPSARLAAQVGPWPKGRSERQEIHERSASVRGDLDWITAKAMQKDPCRRYATAADLAADVSCYLAGRPMSAGPPTWRYRMRKFIHRNGRVLALVGGGAALVGLASAILVAIANRHPAAFATNSSSTTSNMDRHADGPATAPSRQFTDVREMLNVIPATERPNSGGWTDQQIAAANRLLAEQVMGQSARLVVRVRVSGITPGARRRRNRQAQADEYAGLPRIRADQPPIEQIPVNLWAYFPADSIEQANHLKVGDTVRVTGTITRADLIREGSNARLNIDLSKCTFEKLPDAQ